MKQFVAVGAAIAFAGIGSFVLLKVVDLMVGLAGSGRGRGAGPRSVPAWRAGVSALEGE